MSAVIQFSVYKGLDATGTLLGDVQSITMNRGRQKIQDPFKAGTATITGRVPSGLPSLDIGDAITINYDPPTGPALNCFNGRIADFSIQYGFIPAEDIWTLYCEDALATMGRAVTSSSAGFTAGQSTRAAAEAIGTNVGITVQGSSPSLSGSTVSAQSLPDTNALDILNQLVATEQGRINGLLHDEILWYTRNAVTITGYTYTDYTVASTGEIAFDVVDFSSYADSFAGRVVVSPEGLADQESGPTGGRTFSMRSYDETTSQAKNLADYVLGTLQVSGAQPTRISTSSANIGTDAMLLRALLAAVNAGALGVADLVLRGSTLSVFIEGSTISAAPNLTRISVDVVPTGAQNFLILDDAIFGTLDNNRLGF